MLKRIPSTKEAVTWVQKLFNPVALVPSKLRQTLVGVITTISLGEVCLYEMIRQDVRAGEMPSYLADTLIIGHGIVEMTLAPLVSWCGYRRRRRMLIVWVGLVAACLASWFLLPSANRRRESMLCDEDRSDDLVFTGVTWASGVRLFIFLITGGLLIIARVGVWSHGLAYLEEYAPERTPLHYSVFVIARVVPLLVGRDIITMIERNMALQVTIFLVGIVFNIFQLHTLIPNQAPEVQGIVKPHPPMNDRCFSSSVGRVLSAPLVISQLLAMALLAAALWTYSSTRFEIVKAKFNIDPKTNPSSNMAESVQYIFAIIFVAFAGIHMSTPILPRFSELVGIKRALSTSMLVLVLYVLLAVLPTCDTGQVAGVDGATYNTPECSSQCGCQPGSQFLPVCMLDDITTYWSPCQAGCSAKDYVNGVSATCVVCQARSCQEQCMHNSGHCSSVFVNCTCGSRATLGACSDTHCGAAYQLHQTLFVLVVAVTIVGLSTQGVVLLKAVDPRDRSVILGAGGATVALVVNVCTHTFFSLIRAGSCSWTHSEHCQMPTSTMPTIIAVSSMTLVATSLVITFITWIQLRRTHKKRTTMNI